jgi:uncharacterized glyoxalase superfamily protein PhnB
MTDQQPGPVRQLRLVVEAGDFDEAVAFYRDALGLGERAAFEGEGDARVMILDAGMATLEIANPAQVEMIDRVETDGHRSPRLRLAFEVDDTARATRQLAEAGVEVIATPRETPWRSVNARLAGAAGLEITLFQELGDQVQERPLRADQ